jgi:hypothetical protein
VAGQGAEARNEAIRQALGKVLVKLSGRREVTAQAQTQDLLQQAAGWVRQYRYETLPASDPAQPPQRLLNVSFDPAALQRALRDSGLALWMTERPNLLLWLAVEERGARRFFQADTDPQWADAVARVAHDRGVSLLFPLLDVEDLQQVKASDLWGGFESRLREASRRYAADVVLLGRLDALRSGAWRSSWMLLHANQTEQWRSDAKTSTEALEAGLQEAVDRLAKRYAPAAAIGGANRLLLRVSDVRDLAGFIAVDRWLRSLDVVEEAVLVAVEPTSLLFGVKAHGDIEDLRRASSLNHRLFEQSPDAGASQAADIADLEYRWIP